MHGQHDVKKFMNYELRLQFHMYLNVIQGVTGGTDRLREGVPYVILYRYNPKHLYPKLNGLGDNDN